MLDLKEMSHIAEIAGKIAERKTDRKFPGYKYEHKILVMGSFKRRMYVKYRRRKLLLVFGWLVHKACQKQRRSGETWV